MSCRSSGERDWKKFQKPSTTSTVGTIVFSMTNQMRNNWNHIKSNINMSRGRKMVWKEENEMIWYLITTLNYRTNYYSFYSFRISGACWFSGADFGRLAGKTNLNSAEEGIEEVADMNHINFAEEGTAGVDTEEEGDIAAEGDTAAEDTVEEDTVGVGIVEGDIVVEGDTVEDTAECIALALAFSEGWEFNWLQSFVHLIFYFLKRRIQQRWKAFGCWRVLARRRPSGTTCQPPCFQNINRYTPM